jgi:hypothetical protein
VSDLVARRQLNRGYNDGFSRAVEIVVTPLLFGFLGSLADRWFDTRPLLTIGFAVFAVVGIVVKLWLGYDRQMRDHEAGAVWTKPRVASIASLAAGTPAATLDVATSTTVSPAAGPAPAADAAAADDAGPAPAAADDAVTDGAAPPTPGGRS